MLQTSVALTVVAQLLPQVPQFGRARPLVSQPLGRVESQSRKPASQLE